MKLRMANGEVVDVIIYRIKDNSSQKVRVTVGSGSELGLGLGLAHPNANPTPTHPNQERTDKGELSHVMNINFFIDGPQADCSRTATIVGACELQVRLPSHPPPLLLLTACHRLSLLWLYSLWPTHYAAGGC